MNLNQILNQEQIDRVLDLFVEGLDPHDIADDLGVSEDLVNRVLSTPSIAQALYGRKRAAVLLKFYGPVTDRLLKVASEGRQTDALSAARLLEKIFDLSSPSEPPADPSDEEGAEPEGDITIEQALDTIRD